MDHQEFLRHQEAQSRAALCNKHANTQSNAAAVTVKTHAIKYNRREIRTGQHATSCFHCWPTVDSPSCDSPLLTVMPQGRLSLLVVSQSARKKSRQDDLHDANKTPEPRNVHTDLGLSTFHKHLTRKQNVFFACFSFVAMILSQFHCTRSQSNPPA